MVLFEVVRFYALQATNLKLEARRPIKEDPCLIVELPSSVEHKQGRRAVAEQVNRAQMYWKLFEHKKNNDFAKEINCKIVQIKLGSL